jgi:hypothetical protein
MANLESQMVTWTIDSNAAGQWALHVRVGGTVVQVSEWKASREDLLDDVAHRWRPSSAPAPEGHAA